MTFIPLTEAAGLLAVDAKTLRKFLKASSLSLQAHPTDGRIKCLTTEQVHLLADLHGKTLPPLAQSCAQSHEPSVIASQMAPVPFHNGDLLEKLTRLEALVASQQEQIAHLALQLLMEREQRTEQRLLVLEAVLTSTGKPSGLASTSTVEHSPQTPPEVLHQTSKQARIIPLIEYSARGSYVIICPKEGELPISADSPEWFAWLASLSSFRFVGKCGRFSARRGPAPRSHHSWYAQRVIHQQGKVKYLGVSKNVTIDLLEKIAAHFQAYV